MSLYELPKFEFPKLKAPKVKFPKFWRNRVFWTVILTIFVSSIFGFLAGAISGSYFYLEIKDYLSRLKIEIPQEKYLPQTPQEERVIQVVEKVSPAVVSIVVTKDLPVWEQYWFEPFFGDPFFEFRIPEYRQRGVERREIGWGSGFIVSDDGLVLTNRHVVIDEEADYTVVMSGGQRFPAQVLARDPAQDLAILKIEREKDPFPQVRLGDSAHLRIGQTVVAIGTALGEFPNTVSTGVVSGLGRTITAAGGGMLVTIEDVIQTDAAINRGNSGGPLLNLKGEVIGINTAMVVGAENIGFAIPVNKAKEAIEEVKEYGRIIHPFLGVRYVIITERIQRENNLPVNYGAWVIGDRREPAIFPGSAAEKAGLKERDIILEFNQEKITLENSLAKIIVRYNPGDKVVLKVLRNNQEKIIEVTLGERGE